jgi:hypothetical protein
LTLTIDYVNHRIRLSHPDLEPPAPEPGGITLPLRWFEHFPALEGLTLLCADGPLTLPLATLDTGSNGGLTLSADLAARAGLRHGDALVAHDEGRGFVEGVRVLRGAPTCLCLGPFTLPAVELDAPEGSAGDLGRTGRANLGNGVLARFARVTLDYRRGRATLDPRSDSGERREA